MRNPWEMELQYLGQMGFLLRSGDVTVVIDPYLSFSVDRLPDTPPGFWVRSYPPPVTPAQLTEVNLVLCSHDHLDHTDPESLRGIATASANSHFAGPPPSVKIIQECGIDPQRVSMLEAGKSWKFGDMVVEPVAAAHEDYETDASGRHRFLGYLLRWAGKTIYHAGDTIVTPSLQRQIASVRPDVAILPINGRDAARRAIDVIGNMNAAEAATFAADCGCGLVVPGHYDLYPKNGAPVADFVGAWERLPLATRPKLKVFLPEEVVDV